jgi:hypothetical protein
MSSSLSVLDTAYSLVVRLRGMREEEDIHCIFHFCYYCGLDLRLLPLDVEGTIEATRLASAAVLEGWESFAPSESFPELEVRGLAFYAAGAVVGRFAVAQLRDPNVYIAASAPRGLCSDHPCPPTPIFGRKAMVMLSREMGMAFALRSSIRVASAKTVMRRWDIQYPKHCGARPPRSAALTASSVLHRALVPSRRCRRPFWQNL